ncbi:octaprenyl diphosphate synthase [Aliidiomarina haloalkalitolerans]|uniref:Octaprenyl diphosphate synthase n=1 Tax=Aliidiomarina haloalkalitolerans TaxID=859059 RepID=A0A432VT05_9GAMM|nr:octaprenyl diphosphate synthase [Aliidiomarina haloalkalitolerans]MCL4409016.1 octaprenyl diphosphate synthase [Gammaproteobacteria bacterium]RUO19542.1 octaprenyl diphosphate synthase [Aliidiomarina haloalkalitolerans]
MDLAAVRALNQADMDAVNNIITAQLNSDVALINQLGFYIINSGGKRLRPQLAVLAARALGYNGDKHHLLAAIVEFIHTATLLHDDVVDESMTRRGRDTANALFGNEASVLVGDFLYTRAFQLMVKTESMRVLEVLADATNVIAEGEVLQLMNCNDPNTTEASYFQVIYSKTAKLFEAATQLSAVLAGQSAEIEQAAADYGRYLGNAFQLVDDLLDYTSDAETMGKDAGDDLAEGKPTLPLLYAMWNTDADNAELIRSAIEEGGRRDALEPILTIMKETQALEYTRNKALEQRDLAIQALDVFPDNDYKEALKALAHLAVERVA